MEFPRLVYRCPGDQARPGGTFGYRQVLDDDQHASALAEGWFATLPEAIEGPKPKAVRVEPVDTPADEAPPTRAELEQKAHELGIAFGPRIGDAKLAERIAEKLKA